MHTNYIQSALQKLQKANYSGYFEEMDKVVPSEMQTMYSELKGKFITGNAPWNFDQQLKTFALEIDKLLDKEEEAKEIAQNAVNKNSSSITGSHNIVIQDAKESNIHVNIYSQKEDDKKTH
jgi:hypothetical protein